MLTVSQSKVLSLYFEALIKKTEQTEGKYI